MRLAAGMGIRKIRLTGGEPLLRHGKSDNAIAEWLRGVVWQKETRHHIGEPDFVAPPRSMSCIGG